MPHDPNMPDAMGAPMGGPPPMDGGMPAGPPAGPPADAAPPLPTPPAPKEAFTVGKLKGLHNQLNATVKALLGKAYKDMPANQREVVWTPPGGAKLVAPVPMELFVPLAAIDGAVKTLGATDKYDLALSELVDDSGVLYTSGQLKRIASDKKLLKALQEAPMGGDAGPPPDTAAMDQRAMQAM